MVEQLAHAYPRRSHLLRGAVLAAVLALVATLLVASPAYAAVLGSVASRVTSGTTAADPDCAVQTGTGPTHCPGLDDDLSATDQILRTLDTATVKLEYSVSAADTNIQLIADSGANAQWSAVPIACASGSTASGRTLTCKLPNTTGAQLGAVEASVQPLANMPDGTTFTVGVSMKSATNTVAVPGTSTATFTASAAPNWNLGKTYNQTLANSLPAPFTYRNSAGVLGWAYPVPFGVAVTRQAGTSALAPPVTWTEDISVDAKAGDVRLLNFGDYGTGCGQYNAASATGNPGFQNRVVTTTNQGSPPGFSMTCAQPGGPGTPVSVTLTSFNATGPYRYGSGIGATGWIMLWVPSISLPVGTVTLTETAKNFDPNDLQGVSNYGAAVEPTTDNSFTVTIPNNVAASVSTTITADVADPNAAFQSPGIIPGDIYGRPLPVPVNRGAYTDVQATLTNTGAVPISPAAVCQKWDSSVLTLTPWASTGSAVAMTTTGNAADVTQAPPYAPRSTYNNTSDFGVDPSAYTVEYGVGDYGTQTGQNPQDRTTLNNAKCADSDSSIGWVTSLTDPALVAYAAARGITPLEAVSKVRVTLTGTLQPGSSVRVKARLLDRETYRGGTPAAGRTVLAETLLSDALVYRIPQLPATLTWSGAGVEDRKISGVRDSNLAIAKSVSSSSVTAGDAVTYTLRPSVTYGETPQPTPVRVFDWLPADLAYVADSASPAPSLVVPQTDGTTVLVWDLGTFTSPATPPAITYRASTTTETPNATVLWNTAVVQSVNADGTANDTRPVSGTAGACGPKVNITIPPTSNVSVPVTEAVPSQGDHGGCAGVAQAYRYDNKSVTVGNSAVLGLSKRTLTPQIQVDDDDDPAGQRVGWTARYRNLSSTALPWVDLIDRLPFVGDGRTPPSAYSGTINLSAAPTATVASPAAPNPLPPTRTGLAAGPTFYYTSRPPAQVVEDANDASNATGGATTWCLQTQFGTPGCPANLAAVTAWRVISGTLAPTALITYTLTVNTTGNKNGDLYTNSGLVRAGGVTQAGILSPASISVVGSSISGTLWDDANGDGTIQATETGRYGGVTLQLLAADGTTVVKTTTSATNGTYAFTDLRQGTYTVRVVTSTLPAGVTPVWDPGTGATAPDGQATTAVGLNAAVPNYSFGLSTSSLSGVVYQDLNNDGVKQASEPGIAGVTVALGGAATRTATSGTDGTWSFTGLAPGTYSLAESQPAAYLDGKDTAGTTGGTVTNDLVSGIVLAQGAKGTGYAFGEVPPSTISGRVYIDANNDGVAQPTEQGLVTTVTLTGNETGGGAVNRSVQSAADGTYSFGLLLPGTYTVTETQPAGYADGKDTGPTTATANDRFGNIPVTANSNVTGYDFGELTSSYTLVKRTQGQDVPDTDPGPTVIVGQPVRWTYTVTNTGPSALSNITVTDDITPATSIVCTGSTNNVVATLAVGAAVACTANGTATLGPFTNVGTAVASRPPYTAPDGTVTPGDALPAVTDISHYLGVTLGITLAKTTQTVAAPNPPGPGVKVNDTVVWRYRVVNTGSAALTNVTVTDSPAPPGGINCGTGSATIATLQPGDANAVTCTASAPAAPGQYTNTASVTGTGPATRAVDGTIVPGATVGPATSVSHYYGSSAGITLVKKVNGTVAPAAPGPRIPVTAPVVWTFTVTNSGNTPLTGVSLKDATLPAGTTVSCVVGARTTSAEIGALAAGEVAECRATGNALSGQHHNDATVVGSGPDVTLPDGTTAPLPVTAASTAYYTGITATIAVTKIAQGTPRPDPLPVGYAGPLVKVGDQVAWAYQVSNTGDVDLTGVTIADLPAPASGIACDGGTNAIPLLPAGISVICQASDTAVAGAFTNTVTASGTAPTTVNPDGTTAPGATIANTAVAEYFGVVNKIDVVKLVGGAGAGAAPGPEYTVGDPVAYTFQVTNGGNQPLTGITVTDAPALTIACPTTGNGTIASLAPGATVECTATTAAVKGQQTDTATATGTGPATVDFLGKPVAGATATDTDTAYYLGVGSGVAGVLWDDANGNGVIDPSETTRYAGATVRLYAADGTTVVRTTTSAADGSYAFTDVRAASYVVTVDRSTLPTAVTPVWDPGTGATSPDGSSPVTLATSQDVAGFSFGFSTSTISGVVFKDLDNNGVKDAGEDGIEGVTVTLSGPSGETVVTGTDGTWSFPGLAPGTYTVTETQPPAYLDGKDSVGASPGTAGNDVITGITVAQGSKPGTYAFGEVPPSEVSGHVFADQNDDGVFQTGEAGIVTTLTLTGTALGGGAVSLTTESAADGTFTFGSLYPGRYSLTETQPAGYADGKDTGPTAATANDRFGTIVVAAGVVVDGYDFGELTSSYTLVKTTQAQDVAPTDPGPTVVAGQPVRWGYSVTNTGTSALSAVTVTDDKAPASSIKCAGSGSNVVATLARGTSVVCTANGTATVGPYTNTGSVQASRPDYVTPDGATQPGERLAAVTDVSHYLGVTLGLALEKRTQTVSAPTPTGPVVGVGSPVTWTYRVVNTGTAALTNVTVTDAPAPAGGIDCGGGSPTIATLPPGDASAVTCRASGTATAGQYANTASVTGTGPETRDVTGAVVPGATVGPVTSVSHYYGADVAIGLTKLVNSAPASTTAPGPRIPMGSPVRWSFAVTNPSNVALSGIVLDDPSVPAASISCTVGAATTGASIGTLAAGGSAQCVATGAAVLGAQTNTATVRGTSPAVTAPDGTTSTIAVSATSTAHYTGIRTGLTVTKVAQNTATPGLLVAAGTPVAWAYQVANTGTVDLTDVTLKDVPAPASGIACDGGGATIPTLGAGLTVTCQATETAVAGAFADTVTATGTGPTTTNPDGTTAAGATLTASASASYFGVKDGVTVSKSVNGGPAVTAPGPTVTTGDPVSYAFVVTNSGNSPLTGVTVVDVPAVDISCAGGTATVASLAVGASVTCTATSPAVAGQQTDTVSVTGTGPATVDPDGSAAPGLTATAGATAYYFGAVTVLTLSTQTDLGTDAEDDVAPGPLVMAGSDVLFTMTVGNTGNVPVENLVVTQPGVTGIVCTGGPAGDGTDVAPAGSIGDTVTCTGRTVAVAGQYAEQATVTGTQGAAPGTVRGLLVPRTAPVAGGRFSVVVPAAIGDPVSAVSDPVHYFGVVDDLDITLTLDGTGTPVVVGSPVTGTAVVRNLGNSEVTDVLVEAASGASVDCGDGTGRIASIPAGGTVTCRVTMTASAVGTGSVLLSVTGTGPQTSGVAGIGSPRSATRVVVAGETVGDSDAATFQVVAAPVPPVTPTTPTTPPVAAPTPTPGSGLAGTGLNGLSATLWLALVLLLGGAVLVVTRHRGRRSE